MLHPTGLDLQFCTIEAHLLMRLLPEIYKLLNASGSSQSKKLEERTKI